jgi:hypothetical protein
MARSGLVVGLGSIGIGWAKPVATMLAAQKKGAGSVNLCGKTLQEMVAEWLDPLFP